MLAMSVLITTNLLFVLLLISSKMGSLVKGFYWNISTSQLLINYMGKVLKFDVYMVIMCIFPLIIYPYCIY